MPNAYFYIAKLLRLKRFKKILRWTLLTILFLLISLWIFINTPWGQNYIIGKVTRSLSKDLHTEVSVSHVDFSLFNRMHIEGVMIRDQQQDTLLYAGDLKVRITDWFFMKPSAELKYIGLEDAVIKIQRHDSVWNHQFLIDYFSSPSTDTGSKRTGIKLNIKELDLRHVRILQKDEWVGQDMQVQLGALKMNADHIDLFRKQAEISSLVIDDPYFSIRAYDGRRPPRTASTNTNPVIKKGKDGLQWNAAGWALHTRVLKIRNGRFTDDRETERPAYAHFDGQHIDFQSIYGTFRDLTWDKDTIRTNLELRTTERSGITVKSMTAAMKWTPKEMTFRNLDLQTNNSRIRDFYRMSYDDFSDMDDFLHAVTLQGNFDNAEIDSDDIGFFAPELRNWKKQITLTGNIHGTVDALTGKNIRASAGNSTILNGDISMTGLPDINQTFIDFKANDFRTTYSDAVAIVPAMRSVTYPDLRSIQYLNFRGNFTGFIRDFVTFGTIETNLGTVTSDLNMKLPRGQDPVYSGSIATENFNLGKFLAENDLGQVSMKGIVKGRGLKPASRNVTLDGTVRYADFRQYRYHNITLKGTLDKKRFEGIAAADDPNLDFTLNGVIDYNQSVPRFDLLADLRYAQLRSLHITKDDIRMKGKFNLDFISNDIDNFLGKARVSDAEITKDGQPLPFDSLTVDSYYENGTKTLSFASNEFHGNVTGDFSLTELPDAFTYFLNKYYPAYIKAPSRMPKNQSVSFDITTQWVEDYMRLIDTSFSGFNNSHLYGNLHLGQNDLDLHAEVPQFKYKQYNFDDVNIAASGDRDSLSLTGSTRNIRVNDSLNVPFTKFHVLAKNDSSRISIQTGASQKVEKADINALVITYEDGVKVDLDPSNFTVNGKTWTIDNSGELVLRSSTPASGQLLLRESEQEIRLQTIPGRGNWNDLLVELNNVNIGDFSPYFMPRNRLEGNTTGRIKIEDPLHKFNATADIKANGVVLDNDSLGSYSGHFDYDNTQGLLTGKGSNADTAHRVNFDLGLYVNNKEKEKENHISLMTYRYPVKILERFLKELFSDLQGFVTGPVDLNGPFTDLSVTGKARLEDAGLKVNFTQCFYKILDTDVSLTPNEINLDGIVLRDTATGNPIYLNGMITHQSFRNMFFDLGVSTRKKGTTGDQFNKPVLLINTTLKDNSSFYGRAYGTGSFSLTGQEDDLFMQISAIASRKDSSYVTIPSTDSRVTAGADFLVERRYGREMSDSGLRKTNSNITYDVDVTANNMVNIKVVLDPLTGDEIKGRGAGTLNIHSGTSDPLTIRGRYDILDGNYLFTFQSFFKKPFELRKGADNYIEWNGDPYKAKINFDAVYTAENVSFAPLASLIGEETVSSYRENVYVVATMYNELFDPKFRFRLEFPSNSKATNDPSVSLTISQLEKNTNDINRQVTFLIVFNSFAPPENTTYTGIGSTLNEFASSISGILFEQVNNLLNKSLSNIFKTNNIRINLSGSLYNRNLLSQATTNKFTFNQSNFNLNVPITMLQDRIVVNVGYTFDVPLQAAIQQSVAILPNFTVDFLINPSGTLRATIFYRENIDYLTTTSTGAGKNNKSAGASIAYRKDFDRLFGKKQPEPKKKKVKAEDPNKEAEDPKQD